VESGRTPDLALELQGGMSLLPGRLSGKTTDDTIRSLLIFWMCSSDLPMTRPNHASDTFRYLFSRRNVISRLMPRFESDHSFGFGSFMTSSPIAIRAKVGTPFFCRRSLVEFLKMSQRNYYDTFSRHVRRQCGGSHFRKNSIQYCAEQHGEDRA
jgi:hypothetical protein